MMHKIQACPVLCPSFKTPESKWDGEIKNADEISKNNRPESERGPKQIKEWEQI
jgi:hypothetical protein